MAKEVHKQPAPKNQIKQLKAQLAQTQAQLQQTNYSLLNMRQMYEGAVTEKSALRQALLQANQLLTAVVLQSRGKTFKIREATFGKLADYAGYSPASDEDGNLILSLISKEEYEAEMGEVEDEQE